METRRTSQTKAAQAPDEATTIEAQELLRENERLLRESQQGAGIGSYVIDLATGTWKVSPELYKIFGIDETYLHTLEGWVGLLHPDSRENCTEYRSQVESEKTRFDYEYRITRINDGVERWVHGLGEIEYDNQKTPVRRLGIIQDITERKQAKEQLWLTQVTMDRLSEAIFWVDSTARLLYVNDAACRLLGYSRGELLALSVPDIDPNFPVEAWPAHWAELKQRRSFTFESTHRTKEGAILQTEVSVNYLQADWKEYNCAIMRDITERKRAEEALRESEVRYRLLTESTFDGIAIHDQGILIEVNPGLERMFGYAPGELTGKHILDLVADESREMAIASMRTGASGPYESVGRRKDGSTFYGEVVAKSYWYNGREVRLVAGRDITERKRAEEALRESERLFRTLAEVSPAGIFRTDAIGGCLYVNERWCDIAGMSADNAAGFGWTAAIHPDDRDRVDKEWTQAVRSQRSFLSEYRFQTAGQKITWVVGQAQAELDQHGKVVGYVGTMTDITEHKRAEAALQTFQDQIRQMQKMEAIGQLASGIAHDFNNILTAILGNTQMACAKVAPDHPSQPNLRRILEAGDRASHLVQQILTFSHQRAFSRTVLALSLVVNEALVLLRAIFPAGIELTITDDVATPRVLADATQIHQVVMNLCTNAWHALKEQPGHIIVGLAPVTLTQALHSLGMILPPGRYARLSVRDTGCGMDPDLVTRIFDPFFTTKPVGQGTGLGLSMVHGIVRRHDGAIVVDSHPGQGTTIQVYFPAAEVLAQASEATGAASILVQGRSRHLLYLDDEAMLVDLVRTWFEPLGYRVTGCTQAAEALDAVRADPAGVDVVLTDYNMPGMSGLEVARALAHIRADLPVVLVSGTLPPTTPVTIFAANIKAMVSKPAMWQQLEGVITRLLDTPPHA